MERAGMWGPGLDCSMAFGFNTTSTVKSGRATWTLPQFYSSNFPLSNSVISDSK
nr:MAG TPA: hypothetical protein [Caudoviricetes sp.]DAZ44272.1 MAG TPA: hypothetical protein [Caudoviricetes sp.]